MSRASAPRFALALLAVAGSSFARADVWVVDIQAGPGHDFTQLQAAVDAAADGDLILVRDGTYLAPLDILGRSLSIGAEAGAQPQLLSNTAAPLRIAQTPVGGSLILRGLGVQDLVLEDNAGTVWIEDCDLSGRPALAVANSARVLLVRDTITGGDAFYCPSFPGPYCEFPSGIGVDATDSTLWVEGSTLLGGKGADEVGLDIFQPSAIGAPTAGASAMRVQNGSVQVQGSTLSGGEGGSGSPFVGEIFTPCWNGQNAGHGLELLGASAASLDSSLIGGVGGSGDVCDSLFGPPTTMPDGEPGQAVLFDGASSYQALSGSSPELLADSPLREGESLNATFQGGAFELAALALADSSFSLQLSGLLGWLHLGPNFVLLGSTGLDASGSGALSFPIPANLLPAGVEGRLLYLQAAVCGAGGCAFTPPSALSVLDGAL